MSRFDRAKEVDLPAVVESYGYKLRRHNKSLSSSRCPCCGEGEHADSNAFSLFESIHGYWRWSCFRCGKGGTSIDFVAHEDGCSEVEAVNRLLAGAAMFVSPPVRAAPTVAVSPQPAAEPSAIENKALIEVISIIKRKALFSPEVSKYLSGRGIFQGVQQAFTKAGQLYMLPGDPDTAMKWLSQEVGIERLLASGLMRPGSKWSALAFRPLLFVLPGDRSIETRLIRDPQDGEPKAIRYGSTAWPWFWRGTDPSRVVVVEGAIDMLSLVTMREQGFIMGLPSATSWRDSWLTAAIQKYPKATVFDALDPDKAGKVASAKIAQIAKTLGVKHKSVRSSVGHDWNDLLRSRLKKAA